MQGNSKDHVYNEICHKTSFMGIQWYPKGSFYRKEPGSGEGSSSPPENKKERAKCVCMMSKKEGDMQKNGSYVK